MKKKPTIDELLKRIEELEKRQGQCQPIYPGYPYHPEEMFPKFSSPLHYHNGCPCYNNPCYWC